MSQFVPLTDSMLYDAPEVYCRALVPYQVDYDCYHALQPEVEVSPQEEGDDAGLDR